MCEESDYQPAEGLRQRSLERVEPWEADQMEKFPKETEASPDFSLGVPESTAPGFKKEERSEEVVTTGRGSPESTAHYQQPAAYARNDADIEAGAFTKRSEPPPETIAIFNGPPAVILIQGAFALLSSNPETFRGPVGRVLLGVMTVGFICSFMWLLMGGPSKRGGLSSLLQWTAVLAMFVSFFLIMTLLITQ